MKITIFTVLILACFSFVAVAQTEKEDVEIAQSIFGKSKKEVILQYLQIPEAEKDAFWSVYDEYETKNIEINTARINLIKRFAANYNGLNDDAASKIAMDYIENSAKYFELYKEYFPKFKKVVGGVNAATVIQLEIYMQTAIQAALQNQIPIIGELEKHEY